MARVLVCAGVLMLLCLASAVTAALLRPSWYQPRSTDFVALPGDKARLVEIENQISAALNEGRDATLEISAIELNRWLAGQHDLLAGAVALPAQLERPSVRIRPDGVDVAATVCLGRWPAVVGLGGRPRIESESIVLDAPQARVGRLAVPLDWIFPATRGLDALAALRDGRLPRTFVWTNGQRRCQLTDIELGDGRVRITLAPAGGAPARRSP